jgi:hypothetical protein
VAATAFSQGPETRILPARPVRAGYPTVGFDKPRRDGTPEETVSYQPTLLLVLILVLVLETWHGCPSREWKSGGTGYQPARYYLRHEIVVTRL